MSVAISRVMIHGEYSSLPQGSLASLAHLKLGALHGQRGEGLLLNVNRVHAVLPVEELHHVSVRRAERAVVPGHDCFHRLDETALDVAGFGRFTRRVDQPFSPSHGVKEKLLGGQPAEVRVLDETAGFWAEIVLRGAERSTRARARARVG